MLPIDTHNLLSQMPAEMVGIAIVVAPLTQLLKRSIPELHGGRALAMNFFLTAVAQLSVAGADQVRTPAFWVTVIVTTLTASGVHGVGKGLCLFPKLFSLPPEDRDPLKFRCPHTENDIQGRPFWTCPAGPGDPCYSLATSAPCPPHAERLALTQGGAPSEMTEGQIAGALADAEGGNTLVAEVKELIRSTLDSRTKTVQGRQGFMEATSKQANPAAEEKTIEGTAAVAAVTTTAKKPSIWARVKAEIKLIVAKVESDEPECEKIALATIAILTPLAVTVLAIADPVAVPLVAPIVSRVQTGLAALTVAVKDSGLQPTVPSIAAGIISQLSEFETVAGIKDPKVQTNISTIATELQGIADAFAS